MKNYILLGMALNGYRLNNFLAGVRENMSYIGIAGIAGLILAGGGYAWISNLNDKDAYFIDSILNLDVITAADLDGGGQVLGSQISFDSQGEKVLGAGTENEKAAGGKAIIYRLPAEEPAEMGNLPLVVSSVTYYDYEVVSASGQQRGSKDLEVGKNESRPFHMMSGGEDGESEPEIANAAALQVPVPATLSADARSLRQVSVQQQSPVVVSISKIAVAYGSGANSGVPVPRLPVGAGSQTVGKYGEAAIEKVWADSAQLANDLVQNWQKFRRQAAHNYGKLPWINN